MAVTGCDRTGNMMNWWLSQAMIGHVMWFWWTNSDWTGTHLHSVVRVSLARGSFIYTDNWKWRSGSAVSGSYADCRPQITFHCCIRCLADVICQRTCIRCGICYPINWLQKLNSPLKVVQWVGNLGLVIQNIWLSLTPYLLVTLHSACAVGILAFRTGWTLERWVTKTDTW